MKKLLIIVSILVVSAYSTTISSQNLSFGIKGGLQYSNMLEESDLIGTFSEQYKYIPGYNIGIFAEAEASPGLIGEAGIGLGTFGYKLETEGTAGSVIGSLNTTFVIIPLKAKTVKEISFMTLYASGGVYGGYGLSGTTESEITINNVTTKNNSDIAWGSDPDNDDMVRFDYGALVSAGMVVKGIVLEISYLHGFANLSSYTDQNYVMSNRAFSVSLGYIITIK